MLCDHGYSSSLAAATLVRLGYSAGRRRDRRLRGVGRGGPPRVAALADAPARRATGPRSARPLSRCRRRGRPKTPSATASHHGPSRQVPRRPTHGKRSTRLKQARPTYPAIPRTAAEFTLSAHSCCSSNPGAWHRQLAPRDRSGSEVSGYDVAAVGSARRASSRRTAGATSVPNSSIERMIFVVRHRPHAELQQAAVVAEDLVLEEDLLDHLLRAADEVRAAERRGRVVVRARHRRPATLAADAVHLRGHRRDTTRRAPAATSRRCSRAS